LARHALPDMHQYREFITLRAGAAAHRESLQDQT